MGLEATTRLYFLKNTQNSLSKREACKTIFLMRVETLEEIKDFDFSVLGINSHEKSYKLCWILNKELHKNFIKVKDHFGSKNSGFQRYSHRKKLGGVKYDVISNRSENGSLLSQYKTIDYFLVIEPSKNKEEKIIKSLNKIKEILFVFQLDLSKTKAAFEFILND